MFKKNIRKFLIKFAEFTEAHHKIWFAIQSLIVSIPPSLLGYVSLSFDKKLPYQEVIQNFLSNHNWLLLIIIIWPFLLTFLIELFDEFLCNLVHSNQLDKQEWVAFYTAIEDIVGRKINRFGNFLKKIKTEPQTKATIFENITKPDEQIISLTTSLHNLLVYLTKTNKIRVVLAEIENDLPARWFYFMPNDKPPSDALLKNTKQTAYYHAASTNNIFIIDDIESYLSKKKSKKHYLPSAEDSKHGSLICYPVYHRETECVVYVLSLKAEEPNVFGAKFAKRYDYVIKAFANRIILEYNLKYLKENARMEEHNATD